LRKAVFFDLDGTLLPMNMEEFAATYMEEMEKSGALKVLNHKDAGRVFGEALVYMMGEHGRPTNEDAFMTRLEELTGVKREAFMPELKRFYSDHFENVRRSTRTEPLARAVIDELKAKNYALVLATSPIFPQVATDMRIAWAGLTTEDFRYVTYYDNSRYVKPNLKYYEELLLETGFEAGECYMVGNSVEEDLCAKEIGFEVFFLTDYCVGDVEKAPECASGSYRDLLKWAKSLPAVKEEAV
jgi:FMN phosphatase YigB (HAD superfamily)